MTNMSISIVMPFCINIPNYECCGTDSEFGENEGKPPRGLHLPIDISKHCPRSINESLTFFFVKKLPLKG